MATFAGKQPGYPDPTLVHESILEAWTEPTVFAGKQPGTADPTVIGKLKKRVEDQ